MIARYGQLECGKNYKGTMQENCVLCNCIDDENHRLNHCSRWKNTNLYETIEKVDFAGIFSDDLTNIRHVTEKIGNVWNTRTGHGSMHT